MIGISRRALIAGAFGWSMLTAQYTVAATTPNSVVTPQTPTLGVITSSGSGNVTIYTGGSNGSLCTGMWGTNASGATTYSMQIFVTRSATNYLQTTISLPLNSGNTTSVPTVNMFNSTNWPGLPLDNFGNAYLYLKSGDTLTATPTASAGTNVQITAVCSDF
jgi:hypothetical protein